MSSGLASELRPVSLGNLNLLYNPENKLAMSFRRQLYLGIISISKAALFIDILEKTARNKRTVSTSLTRHEIKEDFLEELPNFKNKSNIR